jgi:hypothetical protein
MKAWGESAHRLDAVMALEKKGADPLKISEAYLAISESGKYTSLADDATEGLWIAVAAVPGGTVVPMPAIRANRDGERLGFLPDGRGLVCMQGSEASPWQDFWLLDLATKRTRRLTRFEDLSTMRTFDIAPDEKRIVFDRRHENASAALISLPAAR